MTPAAKLAQATYDAAYKKLAAARLERGKVCAAATDACTIAYVEYRVASTVMQKASTERAATLAAEKAPVVIRSLPLTKG